MDKILCLIHIHSLIPMHTPLGAFLFPYLIMLFLLGIPLFYLELSLGQATRSGPIKAWFKISPNLGGVGAASVLVNAFIAVYYNIIIAWVFFYLFNSFHKNLAWGMCFGLDATVRRNASDPVFANITGDDLAKYNSCFEASTE